MRIQTLTLHTSELQKLAAFYSGLMNLPVATSDRGIAITAGQSSLIFHPTVNGNPFYHFAFNIPANKIGEAHAWMKKRAPLLWMQQYKSDIADFVNWHAKSIYFLDPAGNIVELIARFDLDNATSSPFSAEQIISISEVGLVFEQNELDKRSKALLEEFDLSYFSKQPPFAQFKAIGDDEGLFIIVPEDRPWFPTNKESGIFPMEVDFDGKKLSLLSRFRT